MNLFQLSEGMVFAQGLLSFLSPCVLPIVPFYLFYLTGIPLEERRGSKRFVVVFHALLFMLGFSLVFVAMGATASALGQFLTAYADVFRIACAVLVIIMGCIQLGVVKIPALQSEKRFHFSSKRKGVFQSLFMGVTFAFGWTPCIGPVLASVLMLAAKSASVGNGIWLLCIYSLGLGVPFLILAACMELLKKPLAALRTHMQLVQRIGALLLILLGVLLLTDSFSLIAQVLVT